MAMTEVDPFAWMNDGACKGMDPDWWYSDKDTTIAKAKAVCATCPVRVECREYGLAFEHYGIWGGIELTRRRHAQSGGHWYRATVPMRCQGRDCHKWIGVGDPYFKRIAGVNVCQGCA